MKKTVNLFLAAIFMVNMLCACVGGSNKPQSEQEALQSQKEEQPVTGNETAANKFLITNNSAGDFNIGGSWQNFAEKEYGYKYIQGYGSCADACCDGGFSLGNAIIEGDGGSTIENPEVTIGALSFEDNASFDGEIDSKKYKNNPDVFYVSSDNCKGWYWKDKISYLIIRSDSFKTKEGIGVGSTLEDTQKQLGKLTIDIGWVEEDADAVQFKVDAYPNIQFILDADDYAEGWEKLSSLASEEHALSISDFKKNSKIKRLIISK